MSNVSFRLILLWFMNLDPIKNSTVTVRLLRDDKFCKSMQQTLKHYFFDVPLPVAVTRKIDACAGNK